MKVSTSILNLNFNNLEKELKSLKTSDYLHLDVMDGHFVPNISFGYPVLKKINEITSIPLDTHLMIKNPYDFIEQFEKINSEYITIHIEANKPLETINLIKQKGIKAGITLKPDTPIEALNDYLEIVDLVLVMSVEPGFGGQQFMEDQLEKVKYLKKLKEENNYNYLIQIDGGITACVIEKVREAGVDIVVAGTYITASKNPRKAIESLR